MLKIRCIREASSVRKPKSSHLLPQKKQLCEIGEEAIWESRFTSFFLVNIQFLIFVVEKKSLSILCMSENWRFNFPNRLMKNAFLLLKKYEFQLLIYQS